MRILVNGCSFSRGPISWPYYLKGLTDKTGQGIVNLAQSGAGNTYIHESTISELAKRKYNLVLIMWTSPDRIDIPLEDINLTNGSTNTSNYQKQKNDWPEKVVDPVNDQSYVESNWEFSGGSVNSNQTAYHFFKGFYQVTDREQRIQQFLIKLISLQSTLKQLLIPYAFSFFQEYVSELQKHHLSALVDWSNCIIADNISIIAKKLNSYDDQIKFHPGLEANQKWANCVVEHLTQKNII